MDNEFVGFIQIKINTNNIEDPRKTMVDNMYKWREFFEVVLVPLLTIGNGAIVELGLIGTVEDKTH